MLPLDMLIVDCEKHRVTVTSLTRGNIWYRARGLGGMS